MIDFGNVFKALLFLWNQHIAYNKSYKGSLALDLETASMITGTEVPGRQTSPGPLAFLDEISAFVVLESSKLLSSPCTYVCQSVKLVISGIVFYSLSFRRKNIFISRV
jgi:hypothetical protein